jgi:hypothetical protein
LRFDAVRRSWMQRRARKQAVARMGGRHDYARGAVVEKLSVI